MPHLPQPITESFMRCFPFPTGFSTLYCTTKEGVGASWGVVGKKLWILVSFFLFARQIKGLSPMLLENHPVFFKDSLHIFLPILFALPYNKGNTPVSFDPETEIDL